MKSNSDRKSDTAKSRLKLQAQRLTPETITHTNALELYKLTRIWAKSGAGFRYDYRNVVVPDTYSGYTLEACLEHLQTFDQVCTRYADMGMTYLRRHFKYVCALLCEHTAKTPAPF